MRTSQPGIYACGDITGKIPVQPHGSRQGALAAMNAVLRFGSDGLFHNLVTTCTNPEFARIA